MKTLILTENQVNNVIKKILSEKVTGNESLVVNFGTVWPMGKWKLTQNQTNIINSKLNDMLSFIKQNEGNQITIQIESGESRVTNADREVNPPTPVEVGVLAKRRGDQIVNYLRKYFEGQVGKSITQEELPNLPEPKVIIGETPYEKGKGDLQNPEKMSAYKREQYVKAEISVQQKFECIIGLNVTIGYYQGKNKSQHTCDEAIFQLKMNGVPIGIVNLNNGKLDVECSNYKGDKEVPIMFKIKSKQKNMDPVAYAKEIMNSHNSISQNRKSDKMEGGNRSQSFMIDGATAESIMKNAKSETITYSLLPLVGPSTKFKTFFEKGTHSDTPWVTITNTNTKETYYNGEPNMTLKRGSLTETVLLVTDACGKPIKKGVK